MISIRQSNDIHSFVYLHEKLFPEDELPRMETLVYWIALDDGEPVAFCSINTLPEEPNVLFFSRAGVLKSHRGLGIHKRMISIRQSYAKRNLYKKIITYTTMENHSSFAHLIKKGFQLYTPENKYAGDVFYFMLTLYPH